VPRTLALLLATVLVGGALWLLRDTDESPAKMLRAAPVVPQPTPEEKAAFFFNLYTSGEQLDLGGERLPIWHMIGESALKAQGTPALDYLLSEARFPRYRTSPNPLANLLSMLPHTPEVRRHPRLYPFLLYWLKPENCPAPAAGSNWLATYRKQIFAVFTHYPNEAAVPACIEEMDRKKRVHDLRGEAMLVLLATGHSDVVRERYDSLPNTHRYYIIDRVREAASGKQNELLQAEARAFEPLLRRLLESDDVIERVNAAGVLLRLGDDSMADRLIQEYKRNPGSDRETIAWSALRMLVEEHADPRVRAICEQRLRDGKDASLAYDQARYLLGRGWSDDSEVQEILWALVVEDEVLEPRTVRRLALVDRARAVAFLKDAILHGEGRRRTDAIRFARISMLNEAGPWLIELLSRTSDLARRFDYYSALALLRTKAAVPLLRAELEDATSVNTKQQAMSLLLQFDDADTHVALARMLEDGDESILEVIYQRSKATGSVPDALLASVVHALRHMPGESGRLKALFALRCRGTLAGVEEGIIEAYRQEPSRNVANQIETTLIELAHR